MIPAVTVDGRVGTLGPPIWVHDRWLWTSAGHVLREVGRPALLSDGTLGTVVWVGPVVVPGPNCVDIGLLSIPGRVGRPRRVAKLKVGEQVVVAAAAGVRLATVVGPKSPLPLLRPGLPLLWMVGAWKVVGSVGPASAEGDSGAAVTTLDGRLVGSLFGGAGDFGFVTPWRFVRRSVGAWGG